MAVTKTVAPEPVDQLTPWLIIAGLGGATLYSYLNTLVYMSGAWVSPQYSHGFLIPIFTGVLIAMRREPFEAVPTSVRWAGVGILLAGVAMRLFASYHHLNTPDMMSIIPVMAGIFVIAGGWPALRWAGAPLAFLVFMVPLP